MDEGLPPGVEPFFDLEDWRLCRDFDDPIREVPQEPQPPGSPDASKRSKIKTYVVKDAAYKM